MHVSCGNGMWYASVFVKSDQRDTNLKLIAYTHTHMYGTYVQIINVDCILCMYTEPSTCVCMIYTYTSMYVHNWLNTRDIPISETILITMTFLGFLTRFCLPATCSCGDF